jgi:hypothetical protein
MGKPRAENPRPIGNTTDSLRPQGARQQEQHKQNEHVAFHSNNKDKEKRIINKDQRRLDRPGKSGKQHAKLPHTYPEQNAHIAHPGAP